MAGNRVIEGESVIKYFIIQVVGSCFLVVGVLMCVNWRFLSVRGAIIIAGLLTKLGCFPFHFWVPTVIRGLSWSGCFILSVVQKIIPLWLMCNISLRGKELMVVEIFGCCSCIVGCLGGLGVLNYRVLLGYSSLIHLGFIILICCVSLNSFWFYLFVYALLNFCLMRSLSILGLYHFIDLIKESELKTLDQIWWVRIYVLSLAGLPPFSGRIIKVYFLLVCWGLMPLGCVICVMASAVSLYYYLRVVINILIYWGKSLGTLVEPTFSAIEGIRFLVNLVLGFLGFLFLGLNV